MGFHVAHATGFAEAVERLRNADGVDPAPPAFVDVGTGGGIPGLVLAARWPQSSGVLLDANEARTGALRTLVARLGWEGRIRVVRARAEVAGRDPGLRGRFPVAVARGFGAPPVVAECAAPLLEEGGLLVVSEPPFEPRTSVADGTVGGSPGGTGTWGPGAWDRSRWPPAALAALGLRSERWHHHDFGYQLLRQDTLCPARFPRREGIPAKRPLWA